MAWIGPPGRLLEFHDPSAMEKIPTDQRRIFTSLGQRVSITEPGASAPYDTWRITVSNAYPDEIMALRGLSLREFGVGPFYWVPPGAPETNLLSSSASLCTAFNFPQPTGAKQAGPLLTDEGWAGQSWSAGAENYVVLGSAPAISSKPVTVRAWCIGPAPQLRIQVFGETKNLIQTLSAPAAPATTTAGTWVHHTFTGLSTSAAYVTAQAHGITRVTRPSVTWTTDPRQWSDGAASMSVSVQPVPSTFVLALGGPGQETITNHVFEVMEVAS